MNEWITVDDIVHKDLGITLNNPIINADEYDKWIVATEGVKNDKV